MHQAMQMMLRQEDLCVLATSSPDGPHCSLMAYICDEDCTTLFMVTLKDTRKFINLQGNDTVSVLIDNRLAGKDRQTMQALTLRGRFRLLSEQALLLETRRRFLAKHPHLTTFASSGDACFFAVDIESLQLLSGATDACYETIFR
jgi:nitroimidazol reductase NimA-like FMN-containing flavoprotein (pyridoxamine 5'-phosphate oxidase superfamily)